MDRGLDSDRTSVFINCPFTADFRPLHEAMIFTVLACYFRPRSALEAGDSGDIRLDKIVRLIKESRYSVHDTFNGANVAARERLYAAGTTG